MSDVQSSSSASSSTSGLALGSSNIKRARNPGDRTIRLSIPVTHSETEPSAASRPSIVEIFRRHGEAYRAAHPWLSPEPIEVSPGQHAVRVLAAGRRPFETTVEVKGTESARVNAQLEDLVWSINSNARKLGLVNGSRSF